MEKQPELVIQILKRMGEAGVLDQALLIGSWCTSFYRDYFKGTDYVPIIRTRDIDFLVPQRVRFPKKVDLAALMSDLGFDLAISNSGYMRLENSELMLEFLVPEIGPTKDKPYPLPDLKFNAQALRHLAMLWRSPISVSVKGAVVQVPHPADYCLHKLIIFKRRKTSDKKEKDLKSALDVLEALLAKEGVVNLKKASEPLTEKEKKDILKTLHQHGREELSEMLSGKSRSASAKGKTRKLRDFFIQHSDGSYEPRRQLMIQGPNGKVALGPGVRIRPGVKFMGIDVFELLDRAID